MKRIIAVLLVLLLLAGCSSEEESTVTRTCSIEDSGMSMVVEATAQSEEADVETVTTSVEAPYEALGIDADELTDELAEQFEELMQTIILGSDLSDASYVDIKTSGFDDTGYSFVAVFDIPAMIEEEGSSYYNESLSSFITLLEEDGYSCN